MGRTIALLLLPLAVAVSASCDDDDNGTPTGPSATQTTQTGAFAPQPGFPNPASPASPASPSAPNFPPAPSHPPAPNHPIFGDVTVVTGICPVIRLTVGGRVVVTDRSTVFVLACRAITDKRRVRVLGRPGIGGTMIATVVEPSNR
jgi:hypothetical protein